MTSPDPQPPPPDVHDVALDTEVDAGLASPYADPHEYMPGDTVTVDLGPGGPQTSTVWVDGASEMGMTGQALSGEFAEPGDADHEGPTMTRFWPGGEDAGEPFVSQHRIEAERLLNDCANVSAEDGERWYGSDTETAATIAAAHVEALLALVEVHEHRVSFLRR